MTITPLAPCADATAALRESGLDPSHWSAAPHHRFAEHCHDRPKRLYVVRGCITFNNREVCAPAGIRIAAGTLHHAVAGPQGVDCVEAFE